MSIFLENAGTATVDYSKYETDVDNVFVYGCQLVQESQLNEHNFLKSLYMADALGVLESADPEVLSEGVSEVLGKIKAMFVALGEKIKKLVGAIMAKLASFGNDEKFISNYGKKFMAKWAEVKSGFKFKGYEFTLDLSAPYNEITKQEMSDMILSSVAEHNSSYTEVIQDIYEGKLPNQDKVSAVKKAMQDTDTTDVDDSVRAWAFNTMNRASSLSVADEKELTEKEYREYLFKMFRNDESAKIDLEKSDLDKIVTTMYNQLKDSSKIKSKIKSVSDKMISGVDKSIRAVGKLQDQLLKFKSLKDKPAADQGKVSAESDSVYVITQVYRIIKSYRDNLVTGFAAWTQAFIDQNRQAKAIMAKVIAGGKSTQQESTSYEGTSSGLFDFKIV